MAAQCCQSIGVNAKCIMCMYVPRRKGPVYHVYWVNQTTVKTCWAVDRKTVVKTMCSKSMSCQSSTLSPSSDSELNDSLGSDHAAPTIKKTLSSSHYSGESSGDGSPRSKGVGHYLGLACEDDIDVDHLTQRAFGKSVIHSGFVKVTNVWFQHWQKIVNL